MKKYFSDDLAFVDHELVAINHTYLRYLHVTNGIYKKTKVSIYIPNFIPSHIVTNQVTLVEQKPHLYTNNILIVDDTPDNLLLRSQTTLRQRRCLAVYGEELS